MKRRILKKILCILLASVMAVGVIPTSAIAAEVESNAEETIVEEETIAEEEPVVEEETIAEEEPVVEEETIVEEEPVAEEELIVEEEPVVEEDSAEEEIIEGVTESKDAIEYQAAARELINAAEVWCDPPVGGRVASFDAWSLTEGARVYVEANYTDEYHGVKWYDQTDERFLQEGECWITGHEYTITVMMYVNNKAYYEFKTEINNGHEIAGVDTTINGKTAQVKKLGNVVPSYGYMATYGFGVCEAAPADITEVGIKNISYPVAGQPVDYDVALTGNGYRFTYETESHYTEGLLWYDATASRYVNKGEYYKAGHVYWLIIPIIIEQPYRFAVGVDGKSIMTANSIADDTYVINPSNPGNPTKQMEIHCEFYNCIEPITAIALEGIRTPVEQEKPDTYVSVAASDVGKYEVYDIRWYKNGNPMITFTDTFEGGKSYSVEIDVRVKGRNVFATDLNWTPTVIGTLDGNLTEIRTVYEQSHDEMLTISYDFGACPDSIIDEVFITGLERPLPGNYPDYTVQAKESIYYIPNNNNQSYGNIYDKLNGIYWYDETIDDRVKNNETFIAGHSYKAYIDLRVSDAENYQFSMDDSWDDTCGYSCVDAYAHVTDVYGIIRIGATADSRNPNGPGMYNHTIVCEFPWEVPTLEDIRVFDIEHPTAGQHPDFEGNVQYPGMYEISWIEWTKEDGSYMAETDVFEAGEKYTLEIDLNALEYEQLDYACDFIDPNPSVWINGSDCGDIPDEKIKVIVNNHSTAGPYMKLSAIYICQKESEKIPIETISFNSPVLNLQKGCIGDLGLSVYPEKELLSEEIIYTSSDPSVAVLIGGGEVYALSEGIAVVTASTRDGSKCAQTIVCVTKNGSGWTDEVIQTFSILKEVAQVSDANYKDEIGNVLKARAAFNAASAESQYLISFTGNYSDDYYGKIYNNFIKAEEYYKEKGLWSTNIPTQTYNGKALKPAFDVYYGLTKLKSGKDYTVKWKNNTNAAKNNAYDSKGKNIAPTATITGKGNFSGTLEKKFTIEPINLDNYKTDKQLQKILTISPVLVKRTGKLIKSVPSFKLNGKAITTKAKQYTLLYEEPDPNAYKEIGEWGITIVGSGKNFIGSTTVKQTITAKLISGVTISLDKSSYPYNDVTGVTKPGKVVVKDGKKVLTEGIDYFVSYDNCGKIGTAQVVITGYGNYSGTKTKSYKITGVALNSKMIKQLAGFVYDGYQHSVEQDLNYTIFYKGIPLVKNKDYTISYSGDRTKAGKFKVTFKGINQYSGSVTKTYTIAKASMTDMQISLSNANTVTFAKNGAKPKPTVYFHGVLLTEEKDYKITYVNNAKVAAMTDKNAPYLYITGMGNFTGNTKKTPIKFTILGAPLNMYTTITADNKVYKKAKSNHVPSVTLKDRTSGKKLVKKTDYSATFKYEVWDASIAAYRKLTTNRVDDTDFDGDRIKMRVTVTGVKNYSGTISAEYEIYKKNISSVTVTKIPNQVYTGKAIEPEITVTLKVKEGKKYVYYPVDPTDYEVKYEKNINKGTANVYLYGRGEYGGVKKVTFKITSQKMSWWNIFDN